jgi:hypothetical protein
MELVLLAVAIPVFVVLTYLGLRSWLRKRGVRRRELEEIFSRLAHREEQALREERERIQRITSNGVQEILLTKDRESLDFRPSLPQVLQETINTYGTGGTFELRLERYWSNLEGKWRIYAELWFIYPEKQINERLHKGNYSPSVSLPLSASKIFTYANNPADSDSGVFYILDKTITVDRQMVHVRGSSSDGPDLYIRVKDDKDNSHQ